jgi:hypothetical protein
METARDHCVILTTHRCGTLLNIRLALQACMTLENRIGRLSTRHEVDHDICSCPHSAWRSARRSARASASWWAES